MPCPGTTKPRAGIEREAPDLIRWNVRDDENAAHVSVRSNAQTGNGGKILAGHFDDRNDTDIGHSRGNRGGAGGGYFKPDFRPSLERAMCDSPTSMRQPIPNTSAALRVRHATFKTATRMIAERICCWMASHEGSRQRPSCLEAHDMRIFWCFVC